MLYTDTKHMHGQTRQCARHRMHACVRAHVRVYTHVDETPRLLLLLLLFNEHSPSMHRPLMYKVLIDAGPCSQS